MIALFREFMAELPGDFSPYVERAIREELGRVDDYYRGTGQGFWVYDDGGVVGTVGVERQSEAEGEVRRMLVARAQRRRGIGRRLLAHAEDFGRRAGYREMVLSTSELQAPSRRLYESAGYRLEREEALAAASHKAVGGGLVRYYYRKPL